MKTNSESLDAESVTVPITKHESDALNMSAGAEMLIARMRTNPEDFKYGGKFYRVVQALNDGQQWVSKRDRAAIRDAYDAAIVEADFSEWVYGEIFNPKEPEPVQNLYAQAQGQRAQMQSAMLQGTGIYNTALGAPQLATGISNASTKPGGVLTVNANAGNTTLSESMLGQIKTKLGL